MSSDIALAVKCTRCGNTIEVCEYCEEPDCKHVICDNCLSVALDERRPRTYTSPE